MREVHHRAHRALSRPPDGRHHPFRGARPLPARPSSADGAAPAHADRVPGPRRRPQPPPYRGPGHKRAAHRPQPDAPPPAAPAGGGAARTGRAPVRRRLALPPRVQRRPVPAHRDRPVAGGGAQPDRAGRARLGPRCVRPGPDPLPADRPADPPRPVLSFHRPRPGRRRPDERPGGGHVLGQDRRAGRARLALRPAVPPLHPGPVLRRAHRRPEAQPRAAPRRGLRGGAELVGAAARVPVPHALPAGPRALPYRGARSCARWARATTSPATSPKRRRAPTRSARSSRKRPEGPSMVKP